MALRVPKEHVSHIKGLLELSPTKVDELIAALSGARPSFSRFKLAEEIGPQLDIPAKLLNGILLVLASLYFTRDREGGSIEAFVDEQVSSALISAKVFADEDAEKSNWPKIRKFFVQTLAMHHSVGTASKTGHTMTQHERIFHTARIITDIRPIFHTDVEETPDAAVVVHMLHIVQRDNRNMLSDIFVAMDGNDIKTLKATLDRAIKKEDTIRKAMSRSAIKCIDPEEVY